MSYIVFDHVNKYFGTNHVLKDINLKVEKGQLVTLLGPSGCGKSTLLRCLAGLEEVSSGKIYLDGNDITDVSARNRGIGMVFQQYSLFPNLSVFNNIAYGLKQNKTSKSEINEKVNRILAMVGLQEKFDQYPSQLSGGQQQRVALARAIVTEPKVLLLDEPLSAIDALLRRNLQIEIRRIQKQLNITTIFVTHDQDEAMVLSDMIHLFNEGFIEQSGTAIDLYSKPRTKFAATFIGNYTILPAEDFNKASNEALTCHDVAIRPEIVHVSFQPDSDTDKYHLHGIITNSISHGNIIRYHVQCGEINITADVVYESGLPYQEGETVYLSVLKDGVIEL
jgi:putative spermidine/putrescine transport system ATP-binding protein